MKKESLEKHLLSLTGAQECYPFGPEPMVFKVMNKMFALTDVTLFTSINLKCDPERAVELREQYPAVQPGYHMNKKHWNTVLIDGTIGDKLITEWIDHSYDLIVASLPKKLREELATLS